MDYSTPLHDLLALADGRRVTIRTAEETDAAKILAHFQQVGGETAFLPFGGEGVGTDEEAEREWLASLPGRDDRLALVACCDQTIVGCLTFQRGALARTRHIGEFGVTVIREYWGHGVARALLDLMLHWVGFVGGLRKINLRVREDNTRAVSLYQRLGFTTEGKISRDALIDGRFFDSLMMGRGID